MQIVRIPPWGFRISRADYYGWLLCAHIGPWLVFIIKTEAKP